MMENKEKLALHGGTPVRTITLPYGKQLIDDTDIEAVNAVLKSDWLTTGPKVELFEAELAKITGSRFAVAVSNGTAALHAAMYALGIKRGDEVIVPAITFAATANSVVYQNGTPIFADVNPDNLLIDLQSVIEKITSKTKAIIAVDYAGQPCDYEALREIADEHNLGLVDDACHALGGKYYDRPVGSLAQLNTFSFHPVKHITTGEGGAITTDDPALAAKMKIFRGHGITTDHRQRDLRGSWQYEMIDLGYNYRLSDIQCALGISQLKNLTAWVTRRQKTALKYDREFLKMHELIPLKVRENVSHAYHLYVIKLNAEKLNADRAQVFSALRSEGIGVNVHYMPVHLHPFYQNNYGTRAGLCPVAERAYEQILSLPIFPRMTESDENDVIHAVKKVVNAFSCHG